MKYTCKITKSTDGGRVFYDVEFPDIPEAYSCADTIEEARANAKDVLDSILTAKLEQGDPLPVARTKADPRNGLEEIQVDDRLAIAYAIFETRRGKSAAEVARKWEAGFLRMVSAGLAVIDSSADASLLGSRARARRVELRVVYTYTMMVVRSVMVIGYYLLLTVDCLLKVRVATK